MNEQWKWKKCTWIKIIIITILSNKLIFQWNNWQSNKDSFNNKYLKNGKNGKFVELNAPCLLTKTTNN
jgi:hypothetical protein